MYVLKIQHCSLSLPLLEILENMNHCIYIVSFSICIYPVVLIFLAFHLYNRIFNTSAASDKADVSWVPLIVIYFLSVQRCLLTEVELTKWNSWKWNHTLHTLLTGSFSTMPFRVTQVVISLDNLYIKIASFIAEYYSTAWVYRNLFIWVTCWRTLGLFSDFGGCD